MATEEGLQVSLHPLPLLNISDHYTRQSLNTNNPNVRVVGGLLGTQQGRNIDIINSFELALSSAPDSSELELDHTYFTTRRDQFRQVFPTFDFLGWYTVGEAPTPAETQLHKQFFVYNESPLFLQLSSSRPSTSATTKDLPLTIYETVLEPRETGEPEPTFVKVEYEIETGEAEKVAVDEVSKVQDDTTNPASSTASALIATLSSQRNALSMLSSRVAQITTYLTAVSQGKAKKDDETLRQIQALVSGLKGQVGGGELEKEFMTEYNDALLTTYLSSLTKQLLTANELLDKQLLLVTTNPSGGRSGGSGGERFGGGGGGKKKAAVGASFADWA
ncbi:COP9 signalosome complex subunit 6 [Sporobolomyces salmoneus]|uniref:COP9 signalosome complex subunit 6 n=1 Tax=Sporobolomyces salmoneus TaxID=183962 RepID=UPI0031761DF6